MSFEPIYTSHVYSGLEPSQAFDVVYGTSFEHRLLSSGRATLAHQRLMLGDARLEMGQYNFPVVAQGCMPANAICIGFMAAGGHATRLNTATVGTDEIQLYPCGAELLYHASAASHWVTFIVPQDRLQAVAVARTGRPLKMSRHVSYSVRVRSGGRAALACLAGDAMGLAQRLQSTGGLGAGLAEEIYDSLLTAYVDTLSNAVHVQLADCKKQSASKRHYRLISACEKLVLSGTETDVALTEIARRSGYSLRSLELIFRRSVGMPPGRWFMNARLNAALRELLTCDEACSVSEIAMKWGFRHLPRFAQYYRAAFGELPRDTLRRPRLHPA